MTSSTPTMRPRLVEIIDPEDPSCSKLSVETDTGEWTIAAGLPRPGRAPSGWDDLVVYARLARLPDGALWCTVQPVLMSHHDGCQAHERPRFFRSLTAGKRWRRFRASAVSRAGQQHWHPTGFDADWLEGAEVLDGLTLPRSEPAP